METKDTLTRREWMARAGFALGGAVAMGGLQACASDSDADPAPAPDTSTLVRTVPYAYRELALDEVQALGYSNYFTGGCCYGCFSGIMDHLAATVGDPFDTFPVDFSKFGGGGIAGYGSVCGALLGGAMALSLMVPSAHRNAMIADLFRWYEGYAFPAYQPVEARLVSGPLNTSVCNSHLCHASVTTWCTMEGVSPASDQKKERCARLTADVAAKVAEMLNDYLVSGTFAGAAAIDPASAGCLACHDQKVTPAQATPGNVAAGMGCASCHDPHL